MTPLVRYGAAEPRVAADAFVAPGAWVVGDVELGPGSSVWFGAVVRGDSASVVVGARSNVQDGAVLHTDPGLPCLLGADCTVGHLAIVHGCTVGDGTLVGMGATVLSGATIGEGSLIAAGALVREGAEIPPRSLVVGVPGNVRREVNKEEAQRAAATVANYLRYAKEYRDAVPPDAT